MRNPYKTFVRKEDLGVGRKIILESFLGK